MKGEYTPNLLLKFLLKGIDEEMLKLGDEAQLKKFRENVSIIIERTITEPFERKKKLINAIKAGVFKLIANIPIITPVITAMLEVITSEDLGSKIDLMLVLQKETLRLQKETLRLLKETLGLQKGTLRILDERLPEKKPTRK